MLVAVTDHAEIAQCQQKLVKALHKFLPKKEVRKIGHGGGTFTAQVHCSDSMWFSSNQILDVPVPRYWNAFGLERQRPRPRPQVGIVVEINSPVTGYTKQTEGLFAQDQESGDYTLMHRGGIGGGGKGVGKNTFKNWLRNTWSDVRTPDDRFDHAILVARLESPDIAQQILLFVTEVARFKEEAKSKCFTRQPQKPIQHKGFNQEFYGEKKGQRSEILEYESFHGLVVNKLEERLRIALGNSGANIFNTQAIDLGIEVRSKLTQVFEIKSSTAPQAIYTAIGQLMVHSQGDSKVAKTIVIPATKINSDLHRSLSTLGIAILEYKIESGKVEFLA